MATLEQLEAGLKAAYDAGNMEYARRLGAEVVEARKSKANLIPGGAVPGTAQSGAPEPGITDSLIGAGEAALTMATGATGGAIGMVGGAAKGVAQSILDGSFGTQQAARMVDDAAMKGAESLTYAPRTQTGQEYAQAVGNTLAQTIPVMPLTAEMGALAAGTKAAMPAVASMVGRVAAPVEAVAGRAAEVIRAGIGDVREMATGKPSPKAGASVGAAATDLETLRTSKAEDLPVPITLTKGARTRDAEQLAFEKEQIKGPQGQPLRQRAEENNIEALRNFDALIDMADATEPDMAGVGNRVVKTLSDGWKAAKNKTRAAYAKAENSPEALAPVDPATPITLSHSGQQQTTNLIDFLNSVPTGLKTTGLTDHAKRYAVRLGVAEMTDDGSLIPKTTDIRTLETLRREISQATGYEPVDVRYSTILKKIIDAQTEPLAGPLYKEARTLREQQSRKYENHAIVARLVTNRKGMDDPRVAVDQVFHKSILNGSPDEITFLKRVLKTNGDDGQQAWKELQGATINYIRDEATKGMGMGANDAPILSPAKLHAVVSQLDRNGRLDILFDKKTAQIIRDLNDVVRYVNTVPPGTLINNSGTVGTLLAAMAEAGASGALTGLPVPAISILRAATRYAKDRKLQARIQDALNKKQVTP